MRGNRLARVGLIGFATLLVIAWIAKPKSLRSELESIEIRLFKTNLVKTTAIHSRNGDMYDISKDDFAKLYSYLRKHDFNDVSGAATTGLNGIVWLNRPSKAWPFRQYQHVWLMDGPEPQATFEPSLR